MVALSGLSLSTVQLQSVWEFNMQRFLLVDSDDRVVYNTDDKQAAYEYQNRRRPDTRLVYNTGFEDNAAEIDLAVDMMRAARG